MTSKQLWKLFLQTGRPELYCLGPAPGPPRAAPDPGERGETMRLTTQGIVLRETNYKEADKILTVLTRDLGKRTVKARGCRRKNSKLTAASQLLVYSEMTLSERGEFTTLTEADPLEQFWSVRQDLEDLALASYFAEVTEATAQEGRLRRSCSPSSSTPSTPWTP